MAGADEVQLDAIFQALADSTRRTILGELAKREDQALFEICVRLIEHHGLSLTRQAISKHLTVLEEAGLVVTRWDGRTKLHSSNVAKAGAAIARWLNSHQNRRNSC